ncbi:MAG TPA: hypothetical protein PLD73_16675 [Candidatus Hydrogenedentes bacterium]|jgi:hypothetical protein|nr:hypothetical protein [Candidatus Hydrogenedentota bacterium]HPK00746.1 hypothetical protein [Candidatus Hydrogenedentota bacterium]
MKHLKHVSREIPAHAQIFGCFDKEEHPSLGLSIREFFADPLGVIRLHFDKEPQ